MIVSSTDQKYVYVSGMSVFYPSCQVLCLLSGTYEIVFRCKHSFFVFWEFRLYALHYLVLGLVALYMLCSYGFKPRWLRLFTCFANGNLCINFMLLLLTYHDGWVFTRDLNHSLTLIILWVYIDWFYFETMMIMTRKAWRAWVYTHEKPIRRHLWALTDHQRSLVGIANLDGLYAWETNFQSSRVMGIMGFHQSNIFKTFTMPWFMYLDQFK